LIPAVLWYAHAGMLIGQGGSSRASADNGSVWLRTLVPLALTRAETYRHVGRFLFVRAFTPLGPVLAVAGLTLFRTSGDRLWRVWGASALAAMTVLAAKLHHEYYWLSVAPVAAVGVGKAIVVLAGHGVRGKVVAAAAGVGLLGLSALFSASTWRTPPEWATLDAAARAVREAVPQGDLVAAPEALLFAADRRGCRLEFTEPAARRAAGEWGEPLDGTGSASLVEFYRRRGARYFADVVPADPGPDRLALHDAVRRRYNVLRDRPGVLIARLTPRPDEDATHVRPEPGTR
jgi:hypothetical protein